MVNTLKSTAAQGFFVYTRTKQHYFYIVAQIWNMNKDLSFQKYSN